MTTKTEKDLTVISGGLQPLGQKADIPLSQKITAQAILSREQSDITLAQKTTDLALKEARDDLPKYLPVVLVNEMEILIAHLKKEISKNKVFLYHSELTEKLRNMIERLRRLLTKNFPDGIDAFDKDFTLQSGVERGMFEILVTNLVEQFFQFSLKVEYNDFEKLSGEIEFTLPFRKMVKDPREQERMDTVLWRHYRDRYIIGLVEDVIVPIFSNTIKYDSPIEPENDPQYIRYKYGEEILYSFICNPIYKNEELNRRARRDLWLCKTFDNLACQSGPSGDEVIEGSPSIPIKHLLYDFLHGTINENQLRQKFSKIAKEFKTSSEEGE